MGDYSDVKKINYTKVVKMTLASIPPATYVREEDWRLDAWVCGSCGGLVADPDLHDAFHNGGSGSVAPRVE